MKADSEPRPVIGVGVLVWREKQLLLGRRLLKGQDFCWQFPGGHLEMGESVIECARREVREETGLSVKAIRHLGFTDRPFIVAGRQYVTLLISCEYGSGEVKNLEPGKCAGWQWFDYRQLPTPLFEPIPVFLDELSGMRSSPTGPAISVPGDLYAKHEASTIMTDTPSGGRK
ncbi:MAG TPA: NUDIX domain-containing protein [Gammaproteobacteria bacterium]|nr:NUDIX domain-containing protein [Gammaproteobacteria bacterium]